jgi:hypothetical protein
MRQLIFGTYTPEKSAQYRVILILNMTKITGTGGAVPVLSAGLPRSLSGRGQRQPRGGRAQQAGGSQVNRSRVEKNFVL